MWIKNYPDFIRRIWRGTLITAGVSTLLCYFFAPSKIVYLTTGILLAFGYLVSLILNGVKPWRKYQFVISLTRILLLAYLMVNIGHFQAVNTLFILIGFLSYKIATVFVNLQDMVCHAKESSSRI